MWRYKWCSRVLWGNIWGNIETAHLLHNQCTQVKPSPHTRCSAWQHGAPGLNQPTFTINPAFITPALCPFVRNDSVYCQSPRWSVAALWLACSIGHCPVVRGKGGTSGERPLLLRAARVLCVDEEPVVTSPPGSGATGWMRRTVVTSPPGCLATGWMRRTVGT